MGIFDLFKKSEPEPVSQFALDPKTFARGLGPEKSIDQKGLGDLVSSFAYMNVPVTQKTVTAEKPPEADSEALLSHYKKQALAMAKEMATERKNAYYAQKAAGIDVGSAPANFRPTMTDYFLACERLREQRGDEMQANRIEWKPEVYVDLSGQKIDGFQINKVDLEKPRPEAVQLATLRALEASGNNGRKVTAGDILEQIGKIQRTDEQIDTSEQAIRERTEKIASIKQLKNMLDLDGDQIIGKLYEAVDHHANFKGTVFSNVNFHPAGTLMRNDANGVAWTAGASFENVAFDGMGPNDHVVLEGKQFHDIRVINSNGGKLTIAKGVQAEGVTLKGLYTELEVERASVSDLITEEARILKFSAEEGAEVHHALIKDATIDPNSKLAKSKWADVTFSGCNFDGVDTKGMVLTNVTLDNCHGVDLSGALIGKLTINGQRITSLDQLTALGIKADETTQFLDTQGRPPIMQNAPEPAPIDPLLAAIREAAKIAAIAKVDETTDVQQSIKVAGLGKPNSSQVATLGDSYMSRNRGQSDSQA